MNSQKNTTNILDEEIIIVVDEENKNPRKVSRTLVATQRLLHRSALIYVFNSRGQFFLQKRVAHKQAYPNHWDCSCAGAVNWQESYLQCAVRELEEELGIHVKLTDLKTIGEPFRVTTDQTDEFDQLFYCLSDETMTLQASEVAEGAWVNPSEIPNFLITQTVTPWFIKSWEIGQFTIFPPKD